MGAIEEPVTMQYAADFLAWTEAQASALRRGAWRELDIENLVEEVESMGRQQQAEFTNRIAVLLAHALKWKHQAALRPKHGRSWRLTVVEQRRQLAILMRRNPSLESFIDEGMSDAYAVGRVQAARESGLNEVDFPASCPFTFEQVMAEDWMPE